MTEQPAAVPEPGASAPPTEAAGAHAPAFVGIWARIKEHKLMQWTLAYAAAGYTLLHGAEMLSEAQEWPHIIVRVFSLVLILGIPVVLTLAWYHGAKGSQKVSGPELVIIIVLLFIAGSVLWFMSHSAAEKKAVATSAFSREPAALSAATAPSPPTAPRTALAARARLYPTSGIAGAMHTDRSLCITSSYYFALMAANDVAYGLANACLDGRAAGEALISYGGTAISWFVPKLRAFRQDPRFQALETRQGLMEYWQQYGPPDDCDLKDGKLTCH